MTDYGWPLTTQIKSYFLILIQNKCLISLHFCPPNFLTLHLLFQFMKKYMSLVGVNDVIVSLFCIYLSLMGKGDLLGSGDKRGMFHMLDLGF